MPNAQHKRLRRTHERVSHRALAVAEQRFVDEYAIDFSPEKAALRAGLPPVEGPRLLGKIHIQQGLERDRSKRADRTNIYADEIMRKWWLLATADVNELVQLRRVCCRYCYGENGEYQRTRIEMETAIREHNAQAFKIVSQGGKATMFAKLGGEGYNATLPPNEDCTECFGEGIVNVHFTDTRNLSEAGKALYDGVKVKGDGSIELKMRNRDNALELVAQHLGMKVGLASMSIFQQNNSTTTINRIERILVDPTKVIDVGSEDVTDTDGEGVCTLTEASEV